MALKTPFVPRELTFLLDMLIKIFPIRNIEYPRYRLADGFAIQTDPDIGHNHIYNPINSKGSKGLEVSV